MAEREYVEVQGKRYPLKTEGERARSKASTGSGDSAASGGGGIPVSMPSMPQPRSSGARTVIIAMTVSFVVFIAAGKRFGDLFGNGDGEAIGKTLVAWAFLFVSLTMLADFQATEQIAAAFALLIMLTMLLAYGVDAFERIAQMVGAAPVNEGSGGGASRAELR